MVLHQVLEQLSFWTGICNEADVSDSLILTVKTSSIPIKINQTRKLRVALIVEREAKSLGAHMRAPSALLITSLNQANERSGSRTNTYCGPSSQLANRCATGFPTK